MPAVPYLPLARITALHEKSLIEATTRVVRSGRYLLGPELAAFEHDYARFIGTEQCIGCGNGLDALTLILRAYRELGVLHTGDEVLVSAHTFVATFLAITENGLTPIPVEPRLDTLQLDGTQLDRHVTPRTRALLLVHLYGKCAFTPEIENFCQRHHLLLIEDNAQAHGLRAADGRRTGSLGDAAGHSFYPGKNLGAMGDGGAVTTNHPDLARMVRSLANYGSEEKYVFSRTGRNSRLDEMQAAILAAKLPALDADNARRQAVARRYMEEIRNPAIRVPDASLWSGAVFHIFPVLSPCRGELQAHFAQAGIGTLIHYPIAPHRQACYPRLNALPLPLTEQIAREELSLPCHPAMTDEETNSVIETANSFKATAPLRSGAQISQSGG